MVMPFLAAAVVAGLAAYCVHFLFLDQQVVHVKCPSCDKFVSADTPWLCGYGVNGHLCKNEDAVQFSFLNKCGTCRKKPKAYKCHHCGRLIYLSLDRQQTQYATLLIVSKQGVSSEKAERRATGQAEEIHDLKHQLSKVRLEKKIEDVRTGDVSNGKTSLKEQLRREVDGKMELHDAADQLKKENASKHANNEHIQNQKNALVDEAVQARLSRDSGEPTQ